MGSQVLITGCSSGFGLEAAVACARRGFRVFASMRNLDKRSALDEAVASAGVTERVEVVRLDVTDGASIRQAVAGILDGGGGLYGVVHNAGINVAGAFEDLPDDEIRRVLETNFFGVLALTREVLPQMRERRKGRIVCVSSNSAFGGTPGLSAYAASKWALEGWAESIAFELEPFGIDVVLFEPGVYRTEIWDSSERHKPQDSAYAGFLEVGESFLNRLVLPHARHPREVGEAIASALDAKRPRFRNPMGPDAWITAAAQRALPYRVRMRATGLVSGLRHWKP
ncbi:MAG TPA: SDR family oxidoreductase [Actinomycetota bacterium]|nr:SDR family oxidoreductase [Actinomycetota bacterium]